MNYLKFTDDGKLSLTYWEKEYIIGDMDEWRAARDEIVAHKMFEHDSTLICSSDIDFPEDCTDDEDLIAICDAVRGNV